jgi:hypothetical protein
MPCSWEALERLQALSLEVSDELDAPTRLGTLDRIIGSALLTDAGQEMRSEQVAMSRKPAGLAIRSPEDAKHPELRFRARLTGGVSEAELALV